MTYKPKPKPKPKPNSIPLCFDTAARVRVEGMGTLPKKPTLYERTYP